MSTKNTMGLFRFMGMPTFLLFALGMWTRHPAFFVAGGLCALFTVGLVFYAWFRERELGDKSESIPPRALLVIFGGLGIWIAVVFGRIFLR